MTIQAIETVYKGYRFRSRLEARWAVFMDTLGVEYRYEPEGFELGDGMRYLPDFWLSAEDAWMEVKPTHPSEAEEDKARRLATLSGHRVYMCIGEVWADAKAPVDSDRHLLFHPTGADGEESGDDTQKWTECPKCGYVGFAYYGWSRNLRCQCPKGPKAPNQFSPRLMAAYQAARSARFEHGESGGVAQPHPIPPYPEGDPATFHLLPCRAKKWYGEDTADRVLQQLTAEAIENLVRVLSKKTDSHEEEIYVLCALVARRDEIALRVQQRRENFQAVLADSESRR